MKREQADAGSVCWGGRAVESGVLIAPAPSHGLFQGNQTTAHRTLAAIATAFAAGLPPQPHAPRRVDPAVEAALFALARACLACADPYRALALAIGTLGELQHDVSRSKKRPTKEREQAVAPPHRPKTKRRTERTTR